MFVIRDGSFKVTRFCGLSRDLVGTITFDAANPQTIDLNMDAIDMSETWQGGDVSEMHASGNLQAG